MGRIFRGLWILGLAGAASGAEFAPPAEGPVPFRRDRLPVDVDTMTALSRQIVWMAGAVETEQPEGRRRIAQIAALALALDPANRQARGLIEGMQAGDGPAATAEDALANARSRGWQVLGWLEMPEAGPDGQALAACLGDVLAAADPEHPKAKARAAEQGAWKDWVPELAAYRPQVAPEPMEEPQPEPEVKGPALAAASTTLPLWYFDREAGRKVCRPVPVLMEAKVVEDPAPLLRTATGRETTDREKEGEAIRRALAGRTGALPEGLQLVLKFPAGRSYATSDNGDALTGAAAVLLDAAMRGKAPGATVLAVVEADGSLSLPPRFWEALRELSGQPGMRLVVPKAAAEYLTALLALDDAAFFMKHEVLLAENAGELCELASGAPEKAVADGLAAFAEIRRVGEGKALGSFVAHSSTQQRLGQVTAALPAHASARMLTLQGSGNRPRFLDRKILAREMRAALEPLAYLEGRDVSRVNPQRLDRIHETARAQLDKMPGYVDLRDRDLHRQVVAAVDSLRTLARAMRQSNPEKMMEIRARQTENLKNSHREYIRLMAELTIAAGDRQEYEAPPAAEDEKE